MSQAENQFDPAQSWDSVDEAAKAILAQPNPRELLMQVVAANIEMDEFGFASELVSAFGDLEFAGLTDR